MFQFPFMPGSGWKTYSPTIPDALLLAGRWSKRTPPECPSPVGFVFWLQQRALLRRIADLIALDMRKRCELVHAVRAF